ncbi:RNA binding motif protein 17, isoform CRA_a [Rattus norvegicus]|uniref:RNA binding motif protein 17, isoform CRA_a n=1 Tax=Rattus norvegicus TaxID=10116 RepID=A6JLS2_RAT|nr:RNA binding motif protein 17, isoform CRA_a [Rattus norvegicus]
MSLYDDLGVETSDSKTEGWSKNFKLLQSQLQVKKAALTQAKSQRTKQSTVLAPVIDLKRGGSSDDRQIVDTPPHVAAGLKVSRTHLWFEAFSTFLYFTCMFLSL